MPVPQARRNEPTVTSLADVKSGMRGPTYRPLAWRFTAALALALVLLAPILLIGVIPYAYQWVGMGRRAAFLLLLCSLLGSWLNLPVGRLAPERLISERIVVVFGIHWIVPTIETTEGPLIAVNVGGAVIPTGVSVWILLHHTTGGRRSSQQQWLRASYTRWPAPYRGWE